MIPTYAGESSPYVKSRHVYDSNIGTMPVTARFQLHFEFRSSDQSRAGTITRDQLWAMVSKKRTKRKARQAARAKAKEEEKENGGNSQTMTNNSKQQQAEAQLEQLHIDTAGSKIA
eukprot:scaffold8534_cov79-Skeletonema_dohrnii-CCMP3373.AAC.7